MLKNLIIFFLIVLLIYSGVLLLKQDENTTQICNEKYLETIENEEYAKCVGIVDAMNRISTANEYEVDVYDCDDYSRDLIKEFDKIDINSEIIFGNYTADNNKAHAWVGIWVESISGEFVSTNREYIENYGEVIRDENGNFKFIMEKYESVKIY